MLKINSVKNSSEAVVMSGFNAAKSAAVTTGVTVLTASEAVKLAKQCQCLKEYEALGKAKKSGSKRATKKALKALSKKLETVGALSHLQCLDYAACAALSAMPVAFAGGMIKETICRVADRFRK